MLSTTRYDYARIPDVAEGEIINSCYPSSYNHRKRQQKQKLQHHQQYYCYENNNDGGDRYPEFDDLQVELLEKLDRCIEGPKPDWQLAEIRAVEIIAVTETQPTPTTAASTTAAEIIFFCNGVMLPTVTAVAILLICMLLEDSEDEQVTSVAVDIMDKIDAMDEGDIAVSYCNIIAVLLFLSTTVPMYNRIMTQIRSAYTVLDDRLSRCLNENANKMSCEVESSVRQIQLKLDRVIASSKPTIEKANMAKRSLLSLDPNVTIPDPKDIKIELQGVKGLVKNSVEKAKESLQLASSSFTPQFWMTSSIAVFFRLVFPVWLMALIVQLLGVYFVSRTSDQQDVVVIQDDHHDVDGDVTVLTINHGQGTALLTSYIISIVEIALVYALTCCNIMCQMVNKLVLIANEQARIALQESGTNDLVYDIMVGRTWRVKQKTLDMIMNVNKIDALLEKVPDFSSYSSSSCSSSPTPLHHVVSARSGSSKGREHG